MIDRRHERRLLRRTVACCSDVTYIFWSRIRTVQAERDVYRYFKRVHLRHRGGKPGAETLSNLLCDSRQKLSQLPYDNFYNSTGMCCKFQYYRKHGKCEESAPTIITKKVRKPWMPWRPAIERISTQGTGSVL